MGPVALERSLLALQAQRAILSPESLAAWRARGALRFGQAELGHVAFGIAVATDLTLLPEGSRTDS